MESPKRIAVGPAPCRYANSRSIFGRFASQGLSARLPLLAERVASRLEENLIYRHGGVAGVDPSTGDVVYRAPDGALVMRWNLVWNRLDPFVNNSIQSIIVLDNVPYAFVDQKPLTANFGKG